MGHHPGDQPTRRALLLLNPNARRGKVGVETALDRLKAANIELVEPPVPDRDSASEVIVAHAQEADLVIVGGGDGSLNAAAAGLRETGLPFGILPLGTANDLARTLEIPLDLSRAAQVIVEGERRALDLGVVNEKFYFNVASVGFSASLARNLTKEAKKRWGTLGYGLSAARLVSQSRPFTVQIDHDGHTEEVRTFQVSVGNGRHYGGGLVVDETAAPDDGRLDVYSLEVEHWSELLALVPALRLGTLKRWKKVRTFSTTELTIRTRRVHDVNADGDLLTTTPAHFSVRTAAVQVFVPRPGHWARFPFQ
ncbi:lipid kinase [Amorphus sp. 3PC139-8]|uniref:lipid kinase n=1 Tax=Amorphus sp. 3PC139-8 TaxID=2735676 RepID=UPI00345CCFE2